VLHKPFPMEALQNLLLHALGDAIAVEKERAYGG
jgi:hypothetical protein